MPEAAADRAAVADLCMSDVRHRRREQRVRAAYPLARFNCPMARRRADCERTVGLLAHAGKRVDAVEVDEWRRAREAKIQHRHEALPAGEELRLAVRFEERE